MNVREVIYGRRAVREFTSEPVDEGLLRQLIDAAIQAPSAVNQQPWLFTIVRNKELLARISNEAKAHMLRTSPAALASHHFLHILNDPKFNIFYGAPVLIVISAAASPWAIGDCALAAENLMLAAHAVGLGTCWIGFAKGWLETPEGKSALKLPETTFRLPPLLSGIPILPSCGFDGSLQGSTGFRKIGGVYGKAEPHDENRHDPLHRHHEHRGAPSHSPSQGDDEPQKRQGRTRKARRRPPCHGTAAF